MMADRQHVAILATIVTYDVQGRPARSNKRIRLGITPSQAMVALSQLSAIQSRFDWPVPARAEGTFVPPDSEKH